MLTPLEIEGLKGRDFLSPKETKKVLETLFVYFTANRDQAELLGQALKELESLRRRLEFYRSASLGSR